MMHQFTIHIDEVSDDMFDRIAEACPDSLSGVTAGRAYVDFAREATSLGVAIDSAISELAALNVPILGVHAGEPAHAA